MKSSKQRVVLCMVLVATGANMMPSPGALRAAPPTTQIIRNQVYAERDSGRLEADVYVPPGEGPFPGMLVVHGGAWRYGSRGQLAAVAAALAENGYTAVAISYRLAPKHPFPAQLHDCRAAVRWVRSKAQTFKVDPQRIGGFGYSAGGHLVALVGSLSDDELQEQGVPASAPSARLQVVLAGGAPCDFQPMPPDNAGLAYWLGGTRSGKPEVYRDASPVHFVTPDDPPMFFFHGESDELVPVTSPRSMVSLLQDRGVDADLLVVPKAGHLQTITNRDALAKVLSFADRHLKVERNGN